MNDNLEINNIFKNKIIYELFDEYDSIKGMEIEDDIDIKKINDKKSEEILDKIKIIKNELNNNFQIKVGGLAFNIQQLLNKRNIIFEENLDDNKNKEENKFSEYNDIKENLFNILSKEEINKDKNIRNELIKMDNPFDKNNMELEPIFPVQKSATEPNLNTKEKEEKKEEKFTGKKRTRERKKKEKEIDKDDNNKKKNKKKKVNNKENENNNINNSYKEKGVKKGKDESLKKKKTKKDNKPNNKNNKTNNIKTLLESIKNSRKEIQRKKNTNTNTRKSKKKEDTKRNNRTPKKPENIRQSNKLIEEILKREFELGSKLKQKEQNKNKQLNTSQEKDKDKENKEKDANDINNPRSNINPINATPIRPKYPKLKKKGKKRYNNLPLIIDEELKKSTPIRNLKKQPKSILKKINTNNPLSSTQESSTTPIKFQKAKSSEKQINLSSESKSKKFKTFAEIFHSPSKLKATPLKRRVNSEKKSNLKMNNILNAEDKTEKKEINNKKRNITFNDERIVKEYNPKTPVRDVKERVTRKSPLERKNRNDLIKQ